VTPLLIAAAGAIVPAIGSEFVLGRTKLQTGLARAVALWGVCFLVAAVWLMTRVDSAPIALAVFWGGAFLVWFGVKSHIESSILLRMVFLLRQQPMSDEALIDRYLTLYGEPARLEELRRGGLVAQAGDRLSVTPKGRVILFVMSTLR
jgi:hypothetical protein